MAKYYESKFGGEEIDAAVAKMLQGGFASGEYTGTGTYGSANKTAITLGFRPKLLLVRTAGTIGLSFVGAGGFSNVGATCYALVFTVTETGLSWYNTSSAAAQLNASGVKYYYYALG